MIAQEDGGRTALRFASFAADPRLRHVFTTCGPERRGNVSLSGGRDRDAALRERAHWSAALDVPSGDWVVGGQVHGTRVTRVGDPERGRGARAPEDVVPDTDGLVTTTPGLPLYVALADCAGVLLLGPGERPALGVVHAGWRGVRHGVLAEAVRAICAAQDCAPHELSAAVSPCIGLAHFEVGDEVAEPAPDSCRVKRGAKWHVDLEGWARERLLAAGVRSDRVELAGLDTAERADWFFSHRRDGAATGRMGLIAVLAERARADRAAGTGDGRR